MAGRAKLEAPRVEQNTANGWHPVQAQQSRDASRLRCGLGRVRDGRGRALAPPRPRFRPLQVPPAA